MGPSAESTLQPSKIVCSQGPKIARRWSHVQTESQPAVIGGARGVTERRPVGVLGPELEPEAHQASLPVRSRWSSLDVVVDREHVDPEGDPLLSLEPLADELLGLVRLIRVVSARHRRDVGLGGRLVRDRLGDPGQPDPAIPIVGVGDATATSAGHGGGWPAIAARPCC